LNGWTFVFTDTEAMMKTTARKVIALGFVLLLGLPGASQAQKLVVGYSGITAIQAPFWIIKDAGFFKQEGLDASLVYIAASSTMAQAMMAGEVAISTANSQAIVDTGLQGGDVLSHGSGGATGRDEDAGQSSEGRDSFSPSRTDDNG
jgi:ABC-type nitrate/sulfonate/bicarbonate transport system substrate-binding protein